MNTNSDYHEDMRILCQARAIGSSGWLLVESYLKRLRVQSMKALDAGNATEAAKVQERISAFSLMFAETA